MNIYKMEPTAPQFDWFEHHKNRTMFYDSGEKLAEIDDDGRGKWFYKNGKLALEFHSAKEIHAGLRYVVYSSGANGNTAPPTILASFDYIGNGVVYDEHGNERLKYNQTEGILYDKKIGPPSHWLWHSLNDPPVTETILVDNYVKRIDPCLQKLINSNTKDQVKKYDPKMRAIELANSVKEKAALLRRKYKPFEIRMKALKINDQFSLKIMDQPYIHLLFRDGQTSFKVNLGMNLISTEIVDTDMVDLYKVVTPYDQIPLKSDSLTKIKETLWQTRRREKIRTERDRRVHYNTLATTATSSSTS